MAKIIDGKAISAAIRAEIKEEIAGSGIKPGLAVILVGNDPASAVYVRNKKKACEEVGIYSESYELPAATADKLGGIKASESIAVAADGTATVAKVSTDVLAQGTEELVLFGGTSGAKA